MKDLYAVLESMRLSNGAYVASPSRHYGYVWIRDVCYTVLPSLQTGGQVRCLHTNHYAAAYHALLNIFQSYEWKIDIHLTKKPVMPYEHIHGRYTKELTEVASPWGNAQNDALGLFLWGAAAGIQHGHKIIRNTNDLCILQKLVDYLDCLEYWQSPDNGMWEEGLEVHASSIGACVAGLKAVRGLVKVPESLIKRGEEALVKLLPRESLTRETDLALLSLIYPYQVVEPETARKILSDVTDKLERRYGCIRYEGDQYYNEGSEAEWCFGFPWLGLCYHILGDKEKVESYWTKTQRIIPEDGLVPELYVGGAEQPNENRPLAWAVALVILLYNVLFDQK